MRLVIRKVSFENQPVRAQSSQLTSYTSITVLFLCFTPVMSRGGFLSAFDPSACCSISEYSSRQSRVDRVPVASGTETHDVTACHERSAYVDLQEDVSRSACPETPRLTYVTQQFILPRVRISRGWTTEGLGFDSQQKQEILPSLLHGV